MQNSKLFLNKVIEEGDYAALARYNITIDDMHNDVDRNTYRFIEKYAQENGGKVPSYAVVVDNVEGYEYIPGVSDSYSYLARQIKDYSAQQGIVDLFRTGEFERKLNELGGQEFVNKWLPTVLESVKMRTTVRETIGKTLDEIKISVKEEYLKRELGESYTKWNTPFSLLDKEISGFFSGDVYGIIAESGRGKTYLICKIVDSLLRQGANVLMKSFELKEFMVIARAQENE